MLQNPFLASYFKVTCSLARHFLPLNPNATRPRPSRARSEKRCALLGTCRDRSGCSCTVETVRALDFRLTIDGLSALVAAHDDRLSSAWRGRWLIARADDLTAERMPRGEFSDEMSHARRSERAPVVRAFSWLRRSACLPPKRCAQPVQPPRHTGAARADVGVERARLRIFGPTVGRRSDARGTITVGCAHHFARHS